MPCNLSNYFSIKQIKVSVPLEQGGQGGFGGIRNKNKAPNQPPARPQIESKPFSVG